MIRNAKTMTTRTGFALFLGLTAVSSWTPQAAQAQVRERDVTITGPRGRTVERRMESVRTPGGLSRETTIQRPGGTYQREVNIARPPAFFGGGPRPGPMSGPGPGPGPRTNVFIERDVIVAPPPPPRGGFFSGFSVGPSFNFGLGLAPPAPPPPPVFIEPVPVYVPPPTVIYNPPVRYVPSQPAVVAPAPTVVVDPVVDAIGRLSSLHSNSRRDGAYTLGRLGDARSLAPLIDRLKHDTSKDVRIAAATAIGQIGDPGTAIILQRAITYDKKQEVRDAAALALARMPKVVREETSAPITGMVPATASAAPSRSVVSQPTATWNPKPKRTTADNELAPLPEPAENVPPPPVPSEPR